MNSQGLDLKKMRPLRIEWIGCSTATSNIAAASSAFASLQAFCMFVGIWRGGEGDPGSEVRIFGEEWESREHRNLCLTLSSSSGGFGIFLWERQPTSVNGEGRRIAEIRCVDGESQARFVFSELQDFMARFNPRRAFDLPEAREPSLTHWGFVRLSR